MISYVVMAFLAVAAVVYAIFLYRSAGMWLYDSNIDTFMDVLNDGQREAIVWSAKQLMLPLIGLIIITNVAWLAGVGIILLRKHKNSS